MNSDSLYSKYQLRTLKNDNLIRSLCHNPNYKIYDSGRVETLVQRSGKISACDNWRDLAFHISSEGYQRVRVNYTYLSVHRIIFQKFVGQLDAIKTINHKDGNPQNNNFFNLELITQSENNKHSFRVLGRKPNIPFSKNKKAS